MYHNRFYPMANLVKNSLWSSSVILRNSTSLHNVNSGLYQCTKRYLNVTEFKAMEILSEYNVKVPLNKLARTHEEVESLSREILDKIKCGSLLVKAQVLTGGRGKGTFTNTKFSGVELVSSPREAMECAKGMIGNTLKTKQTTGAGALCTEVLIAEKLDLVKERYIAFMLDRQSGGIIAIATKHGGRDVEEISENDPSSILKLSICPIKGIQPEDVKKIVKHLEFSTEIDKQTEEMVTNLYKAFVLSDALLLEINPLAETRNKGLFACDSKLNIDDNAKYRQQKIFEAVSESLTLEEAEANKVGLNYISLDGNVACIVNGAGLAMATLDLIKHHGGSAANFLDVGGNSSSDMLSKALDIVNSDRKAKVLLVNIVGGIVHCDKFAVSFIEASKRLERQLPVVIRLHGTRADIAKKLLNESNIPHLFCSGFDSAAKSAVELAKSS